MLPAPVLKLTPDGKAYHKPSFRPNPDHNPNPLIQSRPSDVGIWDPVLMPHNAL